MSRFPSVTLANRVITEVDHLRLLESDLRKHGDSDTADAVQRAYRELEHPSVTGALNHVGVNSKTIRP